jgi:hypothetical protein
MDAREPTVPSPSRLSAVDGAPLGFTGKNMATYGGWGSLDFF